MAKRKDIEATGGEAAATPVAAETQADSAAANPADNTLKVDLADGLPSVESPSISPAVSGPVAISESPVEPKPEPEVEAARPAPVYALVPVPQPAAEPEPEPSSAPPRFGLKARYKRYVVMAASVTIGAALGAVFGALMTGGTATAPAIPVAALEQNKAMQQSVANLASEVTTLKANLDAANKLAQSEAARTAERLKQESAEITGSISPPQTVAVATPVPTPRPAPKIAAAESQPSARPPVIRDWSIRDSRGGYIYVEGHGDIYQIVPGAPLPGLGPVQSIKRLEGRWVVTTPKGIIVSMRDRRHFE